MIPIAPSSVPFLRLLRSFVATPSGSVSTVPFFRLLRLFAAIPSVSVSIPALASTPAVPASSAA